MGKNGMNPYGRTARGVLPLGDAPNLGMTFDEIAGTWTIETKPREDKCDG